MERVILHSDMNAFYASVEIKNNPALRGKPVAVCGSTENRHGIVLAKSQEAKAYGIKTGMVNWEAKTLCHDLIIVPPHYNEYLKYSKVAHEIYNRYTDLVEPYGMDEVWLDCTGCTQLFGTGPEIAESIRTTIKQELGLTVSIGVSFNKIFAKLGSDYKKPDAITVFQKENMARTIWTLPVSDLLYVGRATQKKLNRYGIKTIGQLAKMDPGILQTWFGVRGVALWRYANGLDTSRVAPYVYRPPVKSVGHGITTKADLVDKFDVWRILLYLSQDIGHQLRKHGLTAKGVQVFLRDNNLFHYQYQAKLPHYSQSPMELAEEAFQLYEDRWNKERKIRQVTIRAIDLISASSPEQLNLFSDPYEHWKREALDTVVEQIRAKYGKGAIMNACLLGDIKLPKYDASAVKMPSTMYA